MRNREVRIESKNAFRASLQEAMISFHVNSFSWILLLLLLLLLLPGGSFKLGLISPGRVFVRILFHRCCTARIPPKKPFVRTLLRLFFSFPPSFVVSALTHLQSRPRFLKVHSQSHPRTGVTSCFLTVSPPPRLSLDSSFEIFPASISLSTTSFQPSFFRFFCFHLS